MKLTVRNGKPAFPKDEKVARLATKLKHLSSLPAELAEAQTLLGEKFSIVFRPDNQTETAIEAALVIETRKRFDALIKHYNLDGRKRNADTFLLLALALANDFVPNFDVRNPGKARGRPSSRSNSFGFRFIYDVERVARSRGKGVADACLQLSKKGQRWHGYKSNTLETRYHNMKRISEALMKQARDHLAKASAD
jgi:hypothetical protein